MKQLTIFGTTIVVLLLFTFGFDAWSEANAKAEKAIIAPVYDSTGAMLDAIEAEKAKASLPLVYDATGAMLEAIDSHESQASLPLVYDATGAMLDAIQP